MKPYLLIAILLYFLPLYPQNCNCPKDTRAATEENDKPRKIFSFKNGAKIILCGYEDTIDNVTYYSEFILHKCGMSEPIDFWDATLTCKVFMENDVLTIEHMCNLPVGQNRDFIFIPWITEEIFYKNGKLNSNYDERDFRKYSKEEINKTLDEYNLAVKEGLPDDIEGLIAKLFVAAISGDKKANEYFKTFPDTFVIDGGGSETYKEFLAVYDLWQ